jgi:hypothetical protein
MSDVTFKSRDYIKQPDSDPWGGIEVTFDDNSRLTIVSRGTTDDQRQRYAYSLVQDQFPRTVMAGYDLHSGVDEPISYLHAVGDWATFVQDEESAAEFGPDFVVWADRHRDGLAELVEYVSEQLDEMESAGGVR